MQSVSLCSIQKYLRLVALTLDLQHIPSSKYVCDGLFSFPAFHKAASLLCRWACVSECWMGDAEGNTLIYLFCPCAFPVSTLLETISLQAGDL